MPKEQENSLENVKLREKKRRAGLKVLYAVIAAVFVLCSVYLLLTRFFVINNFSVSHSEYYTDEDIISSSGLEYGAGIFFFRVADAERRIYVSHPYISAVTVRRRLPYTVEIEVEEKDGCMYVSLLNDKYALNPDLKVLGKVNSTENKIFLSVNGIRGCIFGETIRLSDSDDPDMIRSVYAALYDTGLSGEVTSLDVTDKFNIRFNYDNRFDVTIGDAQQADFKIKMAAAALADFPDATGRVIINDDRTVVIKVN